MIRTRCAVIVLIFMWLAFGEATNPFAIVPTSFPSFAPTCQPSSSPTTQPSRQPSRQPSGQPSRQPSRQPSVQPSRQPTGQPSRQPSVQPTSQPSRQPSRQPSCKPSRQPSTQPSVSPTVQPTSQPTRQPTVHPTRQPTAQPIGDPSSLPSIQPSSRPSSQPFADPTGQPSSIPSSQPTICPTTQPSRCPSSYPTMQPTNPTSQPSSCPSTQPSIQPTINPTTQPSIKPSNQPSCQPSSLPSLQPSIQPTMRPSTQPSVSPTMQPSLQPSTIPSGQPTVSPTNQPTEQPSCRPTGQPIIRPTSLPSGQPSSVPTTQPSSIPTGLPSDQPTGSPSVQPTRQPSAVPSSQPTSLPSSQPSAQPSSHPSMQPSMQPLSRPSVQPTAGPSSQPSVQPICRPSVQPTSQPTSQPTTLPSVQPSEQPTGKPSMQPSIQPSRRPSRQPSGQPSRYPSVQPSTQPSRQPSTRPSGQPSRQPFSRPSAQPSAEPTMQPSSSPTTVPTQQPSSRPTTQPTNQPSCVPSAHPTSQPSNEPSMQPSSLPSRQPTLQPSGKPSCQPSAQPTFHPTFIDCPGGYKYVFNASAFTGYDCVMCVAGTNSSGTVDYCQDCPPGSYSEDASTYCTLCPYNEYANEFASAKCKACDRFFVTGSLGSTTKDDCINPIANFVIGFFCLLLGAFILIVYFVVGRLQRIAFQKKFRLTTKVMELYGGVVTTVDLVTEACMELNQVIFRARDTTFIQLLNRYLFKPMFLITLSAVILPAVTCAYIVRTLVRVMFKSLILWRAYKRWMRWSLQEALLDLLSDIDLHFSFNIAVFKWLLYPFWQLFDLISSIDINLSVMEVTCNGAQTPAYLIADLVIFCMIVMIVESDFQLLWTTVIEPSMSKIRSMVFNRYYVARYPVPCFVLAFISLGFSFAPQPIKVLQYCIGFVRLGVFFRDEGHARVSEQCDNAIKYNNAGIPFDSFLAYSSSILSYFTMIPLFYLFAEILISSAKYEPVTPLHAEESRTGHLFSNIRRLVVNWFRFGGTKDSANTFRDEERAVSRSDSGVDPVTVVLGTSSEGDSTTSMPPHTSTQRVEVMRMVHNLGYLFWFGHRGEEQSITKEIEERGSSTAAAPDVPTADSRGAIKRFETVKEHRALRAVRKIEMVFSLDWFVFKMVYVLGSQAFSWYHRFLVEPYYIVRSKNGIKRRQDAFRTGGTSKLKYIRQRAKLAVVPKLPWLDAMISDLDSSAIAERNQELQEWRRIKEQVPTYLKLVHKIKGELNEQFRHDFGTLLCWIPPCHIFTVTGWKHWSRVLRSYGAITLASLGIWTVAVEQELKITEKWKEYQRITSKVYDSTLLRRMRDSDNSDEQTQDAFTRLENDEQIAFAQFVSALISSRLAVIQIVKVLTGWSELAIDVSSCPIFVAPWTEMSRLLPPMIDVHAYRDAANWLQEECRADEEPSQILIAFLTISIFVKRSRFVAFVITLFVNLIAFCMNFKKSALKYLTLPMVIIMLLEGVLGATQVLILLNRLLYPRERTEDESKASGKGIDAAVVTSPSAPSRPELGSQVNDIEDNVMTPVSEPQAEDDTNIVASNTDTADPLRSPLRRLSRRPVNPSVASSSLDDGINEGGVELQMFSDDDDASVYSIRSRGAPRTSPLSSSTYTVSRSGVKRHSSIWM